MWNAAAFCYVQVEKHAHICSAAAALSLLRTAKRRCWNMPASCMPQLPTTSYNTAMHACTLCTLTCVHSNMYTVCSDAHAVYLLMKTCQQQRYSHNRSQCKAAEMALNSTTAGGAGTDINSALSNALLNQRCTQRLILSGLRHGATKDIAFWHIRLAYKLQHGIAPVPQAVRLLSQPTVLTRGCTISA
jgi:hypothetical protein